MADWFYARHHGETVDIMLRKSKHNGKNFRFDSQSCTTIWGNLVPFTSYTSFPSSRPFPSMNITSLRLGSNTEGSGMSVSVNICSGRTKIPRSVFLYLNSQT